MDKRIIIIIVIFFTCALGFFLYRILYNKQERISRYITPRNAIKVSDSISYHDETPGATRWKWDFGDEEYSVAQSGSHSFLTPGHFIVRLTVYGSFGVLKDSGLRVDVLPDNDRVLPKAEISGPQELKVDQSGSYECVTTAESYEWHLAGDAVVQKGKKAVYSFKSPGKRMLMLTTHNPNREATMTIAVKPADHIVPAVQGPHVSRPGHPHPQNGSKGEDIPLPERRKGENADNEK